MGEPTGRCQPKRERLSHLLPQGAADADLQITHAVLISQSSSGVHRTVRPGRLERSEPGEGVIKLLQRLAQSDGVPYRTPHIFPTVLKFVQSLDCRPAQLRGLNSLQQCP